jgi:hypothetical protein
MLTDLRQSDVPEPEQRTILGDIVLPRLLIQEGYLQAILNAGPEAGTSALHRLSTLLAGPLVADLEPAARKGLTREHLAAVGHSDWAALGRLVGPADPARRTRGERAERWISRGRRVADVASGQARRRRVLHELDLLRRSVEDLQATQRRLEAGLQAQLQRRDEHVRIASSEPAGPSTTLLRP